MIIRSNCKDLLQGPSIQVPTLSFSKGMKLVTELSYFYTVVKLPEKAVAPALQHITKINYKSPEVLTNK